MEDGNNDSEEFENDGAPHDSAGQLHLRFLAGKYSGTIYPLQLETEYIVGRESDADITLVEDMISRRHALLKVEADGSVWLEDLGSQNGTFINGTQILKAPVSAQDRVSFGTNVVQLASDAPVDDDGELLPVQGGGSTATLHIGGAITGRLDEVPFIDLIRLINNSQKSGILKLQRDGEVGSICWRDGQAVDATLNEEDFPAREALLRLFEWEHGAFELESSDDTDSWQNRINEPLRSLIKEALQRSGRWKPYSWPQPPFVPETTLQTDSEELRHVTEALTLVGKINLTIAAKGYDKPFKIGETHLETDRVLQVPCTGEAFSSSISVLYLVFYESAKRSPSKYRFPEELGHLYFGSRAEPNVVGHLSDIRVFQQHDRRSPEDMKEIGTVFRRYGDTSWPVTDEQRRLVRRNILKALVAHLSAVMEEAQGLAER